MKPAASQFAFTTQSLNCVIALLCVALFAPANSVVAQTPEAQSQVMTTTTTEEAPKIPIDQLDSLVAPIALYPDPLLSQTLVASTYPLEVVQLQQWLEKNNSLKGTALANAVEKQNWDPSIQAMAAALPAVVKQLGDNIAWTSDLGNAFLAQQSDVMDAVQRMRAKAESAGNLKSSQQQTVQTQQVEGKSVVVIQQASPEVVYVPSYNPTVVYGPPVYPYPPIYYPPPGYYAAGAAISFGVGVAVGAAWGGHWGGWGYNCGWGHNDINVNVNNKYVNNYNKTNVNNKIASGNNNWQHNPQHRGGAPYSNKATANKYGGNARGDSLASRQQAGARQGQGQMGGRQQPGGGAGAANRPGGGGAGAANRPGGGAGTGNRPGGGAGNAGANRPGGGGASTKPATRAAGGGGDRVGNRQVSGSSGGRSNNAFGGASGGNRGSAMASHNRGASSMGAARGGGGS